MLPPASDVYTAIVECRAIDDFREMIARGLDINAAGGGPVITDMFGIEARLTPLYFAVCWYHLHPEMTHILLELGADPSARSYFTDNVWKLPICNAVSHGRECTERLIAYGANISAVDGLGDTVLHTAVCNPYDTKHQMLLEFGIDTAVQNLEGQTALHRSRCPAAVNSRIIRHSTVDTLDLKDNNGDTVLHQIARFDWEREGAYTGVYLLVAGASVFLRNNAGETALDLARVHFHPFVRCISMKTKQRRERAVAIGLSLVSRPGALSLLQSLPNDVLQELMIEAGTGRTDDAKSMLNLH